MDCRVYYSCAFACYLSLKNSFHRQDRTDSCLLGESLAQTDKRSTASHLYRLIITAILLFSLPTLQFWNSEVPPPQFGCFYHRHRHNSIVITTTTTTTTNTTTILLFLSPSLPQCYCFHHHHHHHHHHQVYYFYHRHHHNSIVFISTTTANLLFSPPPPPPPPPPPQFYCFHHHHHNHHHNSIVFTPTTTILFSVSPQSPPPQFYCFLYHVKDCALLALTHFITMSRVVRLTSTLSWLLSWAASVSSNDGHSTTDARIGASYS